MQIVIVRAHKAIDCYTNDKSSIEECKKSLQKNMVLSYSKNIGRQLVERGLASTFVEWRFWRHPTTKLSFYGTPLWMFECPDGRDLTALERHIESVGEPDIIWAEGRGRTSFLIRVFELCRTSRKIVYPKCCEPWRIKRLDLYDCCLVDEQWQIEQMAQRHPGVPCRIWDKLVDYEKQFFPTQTAKKYDICYVAHLLHRKNHKLLLHALAKLPERQLTAIFVGADPEQCRSYLEAMATQLGVKTVFTGKLSLEGVNKVINQSKMGVICDQYDAAPRAMLEYMAADVPVLVNSQMRAGTRYVGRKAGLVRQPAEFHHGIIEILDNRESFKPREHLLDHYSRDQVVANFMCIISELVNDQIQSIERQRGCQ